MFGSIVLHIIYNSFVMFRFGLVVLFESHTIAPVPVKKHPWETLNDMGIDKST